MILMDNRFAFNEIRNVKFKYFLFVFIGGIFNIDIFSCDRLISSSACAYPHYSDRRLCGIHDSTLLNGWVCDPDNTISMSEVYVIDDTLRRVYAQNGHNCQCPNSKKKPCWYKFAFAFLRELTPPEPETMLGTQSGSHCANQTHLREMPHKANSVRSYNSLNAETAFLYSQNYARVLREQWNIGECGEDILILVVQIPPEPLVSKQPFKRASYRFTLPMIFVSYGEQVVERFGIVDMYTLPYALEPLRRIVDEENSNLMNTYPLNKVLNNLVLRTVEALQKVDHSLHGPRPKHHIPNWAWMIFAICMVTFLLMAIGLCLIRTTARRGAQHGKSGNTDQMRRWKAGIVGEDAPPTTYVNLVNLLMPHPRPQVGNVQQQF